MSAQQIYCRIHTKQSFTEGKFIERVKCGIHLNAPLEHQDVRYPLRQGSALVLEIWASAPAQPVFL